jgi:hypothetical protein
MSLRLHLAVLSVLSLAGCGPAPESPPPPPAPAAAPPAPPTASRSSPAAGARVYLVSPGNGDTVTSPVVVRFGLEGAGVAPAGIEAPNTGHHHLLIDTELTDFSRPIPADAQHLHFGGGQTEVAVTLAPGPHRLQMVLGDHLHIPHDPPLVSDPIMIHVVEPAGQ